MYHKLVIFFSVGLLLACQSQVTADKNAGKNLKRIQELKSPNQTISLQFSLNDFEGKPTYQLSYQEANKNKKAVEVIQPSRLGLALSTHQLLDDFTMVKVERSSYNQTWKNLWGNAKIVTNQYNALAILLLHKATKQKLSIVFRAYNHGVSFRYQMSSPLKGWVEFEQSEFNLAKAEAFQVYAPNGEHEPMGPLDIKSDDVKTLKIPVLAVGKRVAIAIAEASLSNFSPLKIVKNQSPGSAYALKIKAEKSIFSTGVATPWRVIVIGENEKDILSHSTTLLLNLGEPNKIKDAAAWVKSGRALWDWRVLGAQYDGFTYKQNTESSLRFIDFAHKRSIEYFILDDGWYQKKNPLLPIKEVDIKQIIDVAKQKGVGLIVYYDRRYVQNGGVEVPFKEVAKHYAKLGAVGIKFGFLGVARPNMSGQEKVQESIDIVKICAQNKLLVFFHDNPIPFGSLMRTYPNYLSREYCHAQQDRRKSFLPTAFLKTIFVNMLAGPLDMNNGVYAISEVKNRRKGPKNDMFSTVVAENARCLITDGGITVLPDSPEAYEEKKDLFEFIEKMPPPATWDETKIIAGTIAEYIVVAKRRGREWFIGSVSNERGKILRIKLDFLDETVHRYQATLYSDASKTDYKTNRELYQVQQTNVAKNTILTIVMARGGGHCMWIRPFQ